MLLKCVHGYFIFEENAPGQIYKFGVLFGLEFVRVGDRFTLIDLEEAPEFSLNGGTFLGAPTTETFAGEPWEVMRANGLIYDITSEKVIPLTAILNVVKLNSTGSGFVTNGMILPGSVTEDGSRITDYAAFYNFDLGQFRYTEVEYA